MEAVHLIVCLFLPGGADMTRLCHHLFTPRGHLQVRAFLIGKLLYLHHRSANYRIPKTPLSNSTPIAWPIYSIMQVKENTQAIPFSKATEGWRALPYLSSIKKKARHLDA